MKPQDIIFIIILIILILKKNPKWLVAAGCICLVFSIPLFAHWVFFTAQRLVYYAAFLFFIASLALLLKFLRSS